MKKLSKSNKKKNFSFSKFFRKIKKTTISMFKNSEDSNQTNSDTDNELEEQGLRRNQGGDDATLPRNQSTVAIMGRHAPPPQEMRQAVTNFLLHFLTRAFGFMIHLIPSTFSLDHMNTQQQQQQQQNTTSQPRLKLSSSLRHRMKNCKHPAHKNLEKTALIHQIPTAYFELMMQDDLKDKKLSQNDIANASNSLNTRIMERLVEIEARAPNNTELKLLNYQEWVDMLLKINKALLKNICDLEAEYLRSLKGSSIKNSENKKLIKSYRGDIVRLIEFIRQAERNGTWNYSDFIFETFEISDFLRRRNNDDLTYFKGFLDLYKD